MQGKFIYKTENKNLIIFFSGWGSDYRIISIDESHTYESDIFVVWDYTDLNYKIPDFSMYDSISIIAWSFGVWNADLILSQSSINYKKVIAINGTLFPIDDNKGIPESIFAGTLDTLNEDNLNRFYRRMCGSKSKFTEFINCHKPERDIESLRQELKETGLRYTSNTHLNSIKWDKAIIGKNDNIFPYKNQMSSWSEYCQNNFIEIQETEDSHFTEYLSSAEKLIALLK